MRHASIAFLSVLFWISNPLLPAAPTAPILQDGDMIAICGDSITQQRLYSVFMEAYLLACQPAENLQAVQFGWGGERADGFDARLENDVLPFKPTVVTTCYGMNDGRYAALTDAVAQTYRAETVSIINRLKQGGVRSIVIGSPGVVDPVGFKRNNIDAAGYNETLKKLADIARDVAASEGVVYADVHAQMGDAMDKAMYGQDYVVARDGVHPQANGHLPMAQAFLKAMGCDGDIGRIAYDFGSGRVVTDAAQSVVKSERGKLTIESKRYPFCFVGQAGDSATLQMLECTPFNAELNRYVLMVKNAPARVRVTWGEMSRDYTAGELAEGVNLAADFPRNPFGEPFKAVLAAVQA